MTIAAELQNLSASALIELFELDATSIGGQPRYFHAGTNELGGNVVWQGQTYVRMPIEAEGFEKRGNGALPRPTLRISNIGGALASELRADNYYLGATLTRHRTFARYLDSVNFAGGNPEADPTQYLPDEVWVVDRKANETGEIIEFELAAALDLAGVQLPRRQVIQNTCTWLYRDASCGFTGGAIADINDKPVTDVGADKCGKTLNSCKLRFGNGRIPFGGFPGVGLVRM